MKKMIITCIAICFILAGCTSNQLGNQSELEKNKSISSVRENKLTLEQVTNALQAEGIEMFREELKKDWVLNNVMPNRYSVSRPDVKEVYNEYISIYVYNSVAGRAEGLKDFNIQKQEYDMSVPNIYEHKNVLILYWHHENVGNAANAKFNTQIQEAIQKL